jgi:hypothetical protein
MMPAWKPEFASPKDIADAMATECEPMVFCGGTLRRAEPGGMNVASTQPHQLATKLFNPD